MKHLLLFIVVLVIPLAFCGCSSGKTFTTEGVSTQNNDNYACRPYGFFADEERLFYSADGFYNMSLFCADSSGTSKLCDDRSMAEGSLTGELYTQGDTVWFTASTEDEFIFYEYDTVKKSVRDVCRGKGRIEQWVVRAGVLYFTQYTDPYSARGFYRCDLLTSEMHLIREHILWFGVTENTAYYVTEGLTYTLWECRNGEEPIAVCDDLAGGKMNGISPLFVTGNFFAYQTGNTPSDTLTVFNMRSHTVSNVTLPKTIQKTAASENYAFLTVYNESPTASDPIASEDNGLYRLRLNSGELEKWQKDLAEAQTLFVLNDDCVLASVPENKWFMAKTNVYQVKGADAEPLLLYSY